MKSYFTIEQNSDINKILVKKISNLNIDWHSAKEDWIIKKGKFQDINITIYRKGKVLLQGKDIESFLELIGYKEEEESFIIGADESGKGDYFGPLVTAAVYIKDGSMLKGLGIKDSKQMQDKKIIEVAKLIKEKCQIAVSILMPEEYNEVYKKEKNLNKLLASEHVKNISKLIDDETQKIYIDKFANKSNIPNLLETKADIIEETKAEDKYLAVAAASIIARASFVLTLEKMSKRIGIDLPKGAYNVEDIGIEILTKYGKEGLKKVAKLHFKTTDKLLRII